VKLETWVMAMSATLLVGACAGWGFGAATGDAAWVRVGSWAAAGAVGVAALPLAGLLVVLLVERIRG
jgi:hypothetical protein